MSAESSVRARLADQRGFALEATIVVLVLLTVLIGAAVTATVMNQRISGVDYRGSRVQVATEAGADAVMSQLETAMTDGIVTDPELAALTPPVIPGFTFTTLSAVRAGAATPRTITTPPFAGLIGLNTPIDVTIEARDVINNRSRDIVTVNAQSIPLFQFGVFYEGDLEIHNGPQLDFAGWVHSNSNIYLSPGGGPTNFHSQITTPDSIFLRRKPANISDNNVFIDDNAAVPVRLTWDSRTVGSDAVFQTNSQNDFDSRVKSGASNPPVTPLQLPLPLGVPPIEMVNPRNGGDNAQVQAVKFAWKATWNMTIDLNQLLNVCNAITTLPAAHPVPTNAECLLGPLGQPIVRGIPNAFWEGRENIGADVFEINVAELQAWVNIAPGARDASIIYISFSNPNAGDLLRDYPVVRLVNGSTLLFPMTIATDRPLYVQGDYNSVGWQPASVLADAVTILSNAWTDVGVHAVGARIPTVDVLNPGLTNATPTQVWAAIAAGHSSTPCDVNRVAPVCVIAAPPPLTGGAYPNYGGGLENFPRFLENWGGVTFTYRGSLVSLFDSQYALRRRWSWTSYYSPPARDWQFDTRFQDPANLPPGTPTAGSVIQTAFRPVY